MKTIKIGEKLIGEGQPAFIIAEIGSNFDGSLERAKMLMDLAKECGADAVKFQSFKAEKIVSEEGFHSMSKTGKLHPFFSFSARPYKCPTAQPTTISFFPLVIL